MEKNNDEKELKGMLMHNRKLLNSDDLMSYRNNPKMFSFKKSGKKLYVPKNDSPKDDQDELAEHQKLLLNQQKAAKISDLIHAEWDDTLHKAITKKMKGKFARYMGNASSGRITLCPEETLFLLESGLLELYCRGDPMSTEEAFCTVLDGNLCVEKYQVYSHLTRLGYLVVPHEKQEDANSIQTTRETVIRKRQLVEEPQATAESNKRIHLENANDAPNIEMEDQPTNLSVKPTEELSSSDSSTSIATDATTSATASSTTTDIAQEVDTADNTTVYDVGEQLNAAVPRESVSAINYSVGENNSYRGLNTEIQDEPVNMVTPKDLTLPRVDDSEELLLKEGNVLSSSSSSSFFIPQQPDRVEIDQTSERCYIVAEVNEPENEVTDDSASDDSNQYVRPVYNDVTNYAPREADEDDYEDENNDEVEMEDEDEEDVDDEDDEDIDDEEDQDDDDEEEDDVEDIDDSTNQDYTRDTVQSFGDTDSVNYVDDDVDVLLVPVSKLDKQPLAVIDLSSDDDEKADDDDDIQIIGECTKTVTSKLPPKMLIPKFRAKHEPLGSTSGPRFDNSTKFEFPHLLRKSMVCLPRPPPHLLPLNVHLAKEAYTIDMKMILGNYNAQPKPRLWNSYKDLQDRRRSHHTNNSRSPHDRPYQPNLGASSEYNSQNYDQPFDHNVSSSIPFEPVRGNLAMLASTSAHTSGSGQALMMQNQTLVDSLNLSTYIEHARQTALQVAQSVINDMTRNLAIPPLTFASGDLEPSPISRAFRSFPENSSHYSLNSPFAAVRDAPLVMVSVDPLMSQNGMSARSPLLESPFSRSGLQTVQRPFGNSPVTTNGCCDCNRCLPLRNNNFFNRNRDNNYGQISSTQYCQNNSCCSCVNKSNSFGQNDRSSLSRNNSNYPIQDELYQRDNDAYPEQYHDHRDNDCYPMQNSACYRIQDNSRYPPQNDRNSSQNNRDYQSHMSNVQNQNKGNNSGAYWASMNPDPFPSCIPKLHSRTSSWREFKSAAGHVDEQPFQAEDDEDEICEVPIDIHGVLWSKIISPLVKKGVTDFNEALKSLSITKMGNYIPYSYSERHFASLTTTLAVSYDVYLPGYPYKKSIKSCPQHRIVVTLSSDPLPKMSDILLLRKKYYDASTLQFAVVHGGDIAFYSFNLVNVPTLEFSS